MDTQWEQYITILKQNHLSITRPRREVFEVLYGFGLQTMHQLIGRCKTSDRASIYRTIDTLEKIGVVVRVTQGFRYKLELSDVLLPHHHHIICLSCGKVQDIDQSKLESLLVEVASSEGYMLTNHKLELSGQCSGCSRRSNSLVLGKGEF